MWIGSTFKIKKRLRIVRVGGQVSKLNLRMQSAVSLCGKQHRAQHEVKHIAINETQIAARLC
jgi:hypothetical protein